MGGEFWSYFVPYEESVAAALEKLREQEFRAGRFFQSALIDPGFFGRLIGRAPAKPPPPRNIDEALKYSGATGTRSILDMERISERPDYGAVTPVPWSDYERLFGTDQPDREAVEQSEELVENLERGQGVYVIIYREGKPHEIYFAGYSFD